MGDEEGVNGSLVTFDAGMGHGVSLCVSHCGAIIPYFRQESQAVNTG
jgi:hypothetical protein